MKLISSMYRMHILHDQLWIGTGTSVPIEASKRNFPFKEIMTDRLSDQPTDRWTDRVKGKFHFQKGHGTKQRDI